MCLCPSSVVCAVLCCRPCCLRLLLCCLCSLSYVHIHPAAMSFSHCSMLLLFFSPVLCICIIAMPLLLPATCQSLTLAPALFPDLCMYCCPDISQNENGNEYPHFVFCGLSAAVRWMCCDLLLADTMKAAPAAVCSSCSLCFHSFLLSPVNLARIAAGICFLFFLKIFSSFISRFNNPTVFLE